jgi:hypothetical protein
MKTSAHPLEQRIVPWGNDDGDWERRGPGSGVHREDRFYAQGGVEGSIGALLRPNNSGYPALPEALAAWWDRRWPSPPGDALDEVEDGS